MVRVFRCHNFRAQTILPVANEPVCFSTGGGKVFIGNKDSRVDIFDRQKGNEWSLYASFQTGASVSQIEYNDFGDYIVCVEKKTSKRSEVVSVKVYLNWNIAHIVKDDYRTRVRVAGLGYRSTDVEIGKRLEVVDIPSEHRVETLTTCQQTGNLVIVSGCFVKLYQMVEKTIPNSSTTYHDMILFLSLTYEIPVSKFSLCEDYAASACSEYVQIFQINISNDAKGQSSATHDKSQDPLTSPLKRRSSSAVLSSITPRTDSFSSPKFNEAVTKKLGSRKESIKFSMIGDRSVSTPSPSFTADKQIPNSVIENDDEYVEWNFSSTNNKGQGSRLDDSTVFLKDLQSFSMNTSAEPDMPILRDLRGGNHNTTGEVTLTSLMYKYLDESDLSWIHLQLIPTYLIEERLSLKEQDNPLHSSRYASMADISCFMSGVRAGFMYSLIPRPSLLSTYKYSCDALQMVTNGRLLFVLVENGLETYTARTRIAALHNSQAFDNIKQACPKPDLDICMCGVQQFLGVRDVAILDNYVILHTNMAEVSQGSVWNVYGLEDSKIADLYHDMVQFGSKYQKNAIDTYHHLLLEGHMTLRSNLIGQQLNQSEMITIQDLLHESCALLGEYYAIPENEEWYLSLPYYNMSGLGLMDVVRQIQQFRQHYLKGSEDSYGEGFVHFLKHVLFLDEDPLDIKQSDCDTIVEICGKSFPDKLSMLVMTSRIQSFTPQTTLKLLQSRSKKQPVHDQNALCLDVLAMVSLNLSMCEPEEARSMLSTLDKNTLQTVCTEYHQILHSSFQEFSPLAQFLRCHCPDILINILVTLHDRDVVAMDLAIQLLQGKSGIPAVHKNTHVRDYLERLVGDDTRKYCFEEAVIQLCEIYIARLAEWEPPSSREITTSMKLRLPIGSGHFGRRHVWLDNIEPFSGAKSINSPCQYLVLSHGRRAGKFLQCQKTDKKCSCFLCNEDLLKLQSLLCSDQCSTSLYQSIQSSIAVYKDHMFYKSNNLLCKIHLDITTALEDVVHSHIDICPAFAVSILKQDSKKSTIAVYKDHLFYKSITLLCKIHLDITTALEDVVHSHIDICPAFAVSILKQDSKKIHLDISNALEDVVHSHIDICPAFAVSILKQDSKKWEILLNCIIEFNQNIQTHEQTDKDGAERLLNILKDVLTEMSRCLPPENFVTILPENGNFFFFMPYIKMCMDNVKRHEQKEFILGLGEKLGK